MSSINAQMTAVSQTPPVSWWWGHNMNPGKTEDGEGDWEVRMTFQNAGDIMPWIWVLFALAPPADTKVSDLAITV